MKKEKILKEEKDKDNKKIFISKIWIKLKKFILKKYEQHLKNYIKELSLKVDLYFLLIILILSSLSIYILDNNIKKNLIILIIYICLFIYLFGIRNDSNSKKITEFDIILFPTNIFSILLIFTFLFIDLNKNNLSLQDIFFDILLIISIILDFILLVYRINLYNKLNTPIKCDIQDKSQEINKEVYTLSEILYSPNPNNEEITDYSEYYLNDSNLKNIEIIDNDKIDSDLFIRTQFVDNLHYSITSTSNYSDSFSIGVVGEWGSGKSSIIYLTIKELIKENINNYIIIDDFDPWAIKSQDALILAMYNTIMDALGENISYFKRKKVQNALINITTNIPYIGKGLGNYFENRIDDYSEYKEIKSDLEEKLEKSDKRLIFIIDNLDRMNSENVLFLLTLIGTLFKLPNITYIVAYDKKRLNKIFRTDKIDPQYIKKIVTKEIVVPKIPNSLKEVIFAQCLQNCINFKSSYQLSLITEKKDDIEEIHEEILNEVASKFNNIREFIRFLNFIIYDINDTFLDRWDFLIIKTIEFLDHGLYNKLSKNKRFITRKIAKNDLEQYKSLKELNLTENFNLIQKLSKKEKDFFEQIKESNFFDLLKLLSLNSTFFYNLGLTNPEELYPICEPNSDALIFSIFNISRFDDYFSHSIYSKELKEITKSFKIENNIEFSNIKEFFDTNNRYLEKKYLVSLNRFLVLITNKKDKNKKLKMNLFYYFIDKILFYQKKDLNLYVIVVGILDSLFGLNRELLSEGEEEEITEQDMYYCSNTIKNFLQDIKSEDSIIAKRTIEFIKEAVEIEYNFMINEIYTKVLKMALDELEKENINNK